MSESYVAIVIVNWNGAPDTIECLESLEFLNYSNFKVFVVDNDSTDNSLSMLDKYLESHSMSKLNLQVIKNDSNKGFAGGNNVAIQEAKKQNFDYIWLLNNDTIVDKNSLINLIKIIDNDDTIGIVGSKIYYYNTKVIWFAGGRINTWTGEAKHRGYRINEEDKVCYTENERTDYITGCSMLIKTKLVEDLGLLPEYYFMYYEETEYNLKANQRGWKIIFVPSSIIYHKVSLSSGGESQISPYVAYYSIRNGLWMIRTTQNNFKKVTSSFYVFWKSVKWLIKIFVRHQDDKITRVRYIFKGLIHSFYKIEKLSVNK